MNFGAVKFIKNSDVCLITGTSKQSSKKCFGFEVMLPDNYFY